MVHRIETRPRPSRRSGSAELMWPTTSRAARFARWAMRRPCRCAACIKHFRDEFEYHVEHKHCLVPSICLTHSWKARQIAAGRISAARAKSSGNEVLARKIVMVEIEIDGKKVEVHEGSMVMHAANKLGTYIPHFCYHKKLSIAANCRMCLVEVEKTPETAACLRHAGQRRHDRAHQVDKAVKAQKARDGIPADQPSAGLPDLRPGRRMPVAGSGGRLRRRRLALSAKKSAWCSTRTSAR